MRKIAIVPLLIILAAVTVLVGCTEEAPAPSQQPTVISPEPSPTQGGTTIVPKITIPATSTPTQTTQKKFQLKFNDWGPAGIGIGKLHTQAADMIRERTDGNVDITCYFGQSLLNYPDTYRGVSSGITDITLYVIGATSGVHVINDVINLPFIGFPDMYKARQIFTELRQKYDEFDKENAKQNTAWLDLRSMAPYNLHLVNHAAVMPTDLRGEKVIAGNVYGDLLEAVGAARVQMGPPDWYMSLERGLCQAQIVHNAAVHDFKTVELFNYHTIFGTSGSSMAAIGFLINLDTWNELPPEYREIVQDTYVEITTDEIGLDLGLADLMVQEAQDMGHTITYLTPDQIAQWAALNESYNEKWVADAVAKGWTRAGEILAEAQRLSKEYS